MLQKVFCSSREPASRRLRRLLVASLFLFAVNLATAHPAWYTRVWQADDGLPNNTVTAVVQTQDGFLWVGTSGGLVRFDGASFVEVPYFPDGSDRDPNVRNLLPSRSGGLWIVPDTGPVVCLNSDLTPVSLPIAKLPNDNVIAITEDREGFWIGYADGSIWRIKDGKVAQFGAEEGVPPGTVNSFVCDVDGNVWLVKNGTVCLLRGDKFDRVVTPKGKVHVVPARTNGVWITAGMQISRCGVDGNVKDYGTIPTANTVVVIRTLIEDRNGTLWVGTDAGGLFHSQGSGFESIEVSHPFVSCLTEDSEGNVWVGTLGGGLSRVFPSAVRLEGKQDGASLVTIRSVCEDTNGVLWGATQNGFVVCRVNGVWSVPADTNLSALVDITCITRQGEDLWFAGHSRISRWRGDTLTSWDAKKGVTGSFITQLFAASNGDLWLCERGMVGSGAILQRVTGEKVDSFPLPKTVGRIPVMAEDTAGTIWVGTSAGMLFRFDGEKFADVTSMTGLSGRGIRILYSMPDGSVWIGYAGWGLGWIKDGRFARISSGQGLPDNYISKITSDEEGWFWFGGDRGVFKIRRNELEKAMQDRGSRVTAIRYGKNEGLFSQQADATISPGTWRSHDGQIWMPLRSALAAINPKIRREQPQPPTVWLTRLVVDDRQVASYGSFSGRQQAANLKTLKEPLRLTPRHHQIDFEFSALSFSAPENVHFRYQLAGFDEDWVDGGMQRKIRYSRLPAGEYQLRVAACNSDGVWNEVRTPLALIVAPFFWQTGWFQLGVLLVFSGSLIALVRYIALRRVHWRLQALEQQAALDKSRMAGMAEVAASVLHNVGNVLNSVNVSVTMIRDKVRHVKIPNLQKAVGLLKEHDSHLPEFFANDPKGKQLPDYLSGLAQHFGEEQEAILGEIKSLDENLEHIKDIVVSQQRYTQAAGHVETFKPTDVVDDALQIHTSGLEESRVRVVREYEDMPPVVTDKHKVLQILVNLIGNARQALATAGSDEKRLVVRVASDRTDRVVISVTDNGIGIQKEKLTRIFQQGFATSKGGHGLGLHSGANAARELGGSLVAQSQGPGTGATFTLEFPMRATHLGKSNSGSLNGHGNQPKSVAGRQDHCATL